MRKGAGEDNCIFPKRFFWLNRTPMNPDVQKRTDIEDNCFVRRRDVSFTFSTCVVDICCASGCWFSEYLNIPFIYFKSVGKINISIWFCVLNECGQNDIYCFSGEGHIVAACFCISGDEFPMLLLRRESENLWRQEENAKDFNFVEMSRMQSISGNRIRFFSNHQDNECSVPHRWSQSVPLAICLVVNQIVIF